MSRNVKGVLFADYVRMIRSLKDVDWSSQLEPQDLTYLVQRIDPSDWYPMASFERMGNAILAELAKDDLDAVRMWGRLSVDHLRAANPALVADLNPVETLMRFRVLRSTYFDFDALTVLTLAEDHARVGVHYHMGPRAEEAASLQTMGFFERLVELSGAEHVHAKFAERSWAGDPRTVVEIDWAMPRPSRA